jgi:hypothetical protein
VAEIARRRCNLDVLTAQDAGTLEWPDELQLRFAAQDDRCLITRDRDDFHDLTIAAYESQTPHAGVLILTRSLPNDRFAAIAAALCAFAARFPNGLQSYEFTYLTPA